LQVADLARLFEEVEFVFSADLAAGASDNQFMLHRKEGSTTIVMTTLALATLVIKIKWLWGS